MTCADGRLARATSNEREHIDGKVGRLVLPPQGLNELQ